MILDGSQNERLKLPKVNLDKVKRQDEERVLNGRAPLYAKALQVDVTPWKKGKWELAGKLARWRLRLISAGALSLSLAFESYRMPPGGRLVIYSPNGQRIGPFTAKDNEEHAQLWTPPMLTDNLVLELTLPVDQFEELDLRLTRVHHGYAGFGEDEPKSGTCQRDVACSSSEVWRDAARSVALVSIAGVRFCSGFLVNNTAIDGRPFFITARHCGVNQRNAPSVVVFWNHQSPVCRNGALSSPSQATARTA